MPQPAAAADPWAQFPDAPPAGASPGAAAPPQNAQAPGGNDPWAQFPDAPPADGAPPQDPRARVGDTIVQAGKDAIGGAELLLGAATSVPAAAVGALGYGAAAVTKALGTDVDPSAVQSDLVNRFTYSPQTDSGKAGASTLKNLIAPVVEPVVQGYGRATEAVAQRSPFAGNLMRDAPGAFQAASALVPGAVGVRQAMNAPVRAAAPVVARAAPAAAPAIATTAEEVLARQAAASPTNMGAAAAAPSLANVSPELRAAIVETARKTGGAVNPEALQRHIDADEVFRGTNAKLTEGQATGDVALLSEEQNMRARVPQFAQNFDAQNRALGGKLQSIRDEVGPDVFSANHVEHGDTLIGAYRTVDAAREAQVNKAYADLRAAAGGQFPIGAKTLLDNSAKALHGQLIYDHAPKSVMSALAGFAEKPGSMTFENFEALRTNLATIQRTATDGLERKAAGLIRQQMEDLPLVPGAAKLKPIADKARKLARDRFAAIEADPAYDAAINETVPPDRFIQKFVVGGTRDNLALMASTLGTDDAARQTMGVAALDYLRDAARLSAGYEGNFATASYTKALNKLSPSVRSLLPARVADQLEQLGRVASYTTAQPRGSFVNNSNTFVAGAAESAKGAAEGAANFAAQGVPVGTWIRKGMEGASHRRQARGAMAPGAGLGRLREQ